MAHQLLIVDDESGILQAIRRMLRAEPWQILEAHSGDEACQLLNQHAIDLLITDYKMPGMNGIELCRYARQHSPATYRLLLSGQVDYNSLRNAWRLGDIHRFVAKPWDNLLLTMDIREGLRQHELLRQTQALQQAVGSTQPLLLTDSNWIIRLTNQAMCNLLQFSEEELLGTNLFAPTLCDAPVALEAEINRQADAGEVWLGLFALMNQQQQPLPSWMSISTLGPFRLCIAQRMSEHMPMPSAPVGEPGTALLDNQPQSAPALLLIDLDADQIREHQLAQTCFQRVQQCIGDAYELYAPQDHLLRVLIPADVSCGEIEQLQEDIGTDLRDPLPMSDKPIKLRRLMRVEHCPSDQPDWRAWLRQHIGLQDTSPPAKHTDEINLQGQQVMPVFNQQGELVALQAPRRVQQWPSWLESVAELCRTLFKQPPPVIINLAQVAELSVDQLSCTSAAGLDCYVIVSEDQLLSDDESTTQLRQMLYQQDCKLLVADFGRNFLNSRQLLSMPVCGLCLAPEYLAHMRTHKSMAQSRRLLQRLRDNNMILYAPGVDDAEALAAAHHQQADWLSGQLLSPEVDVSQLQWFANGD
ncbi:hypothetical protein CHH28_17245 [Bacterioplanes sanyensis]|uniref:Response regulatory domain-containing protein n=1 Tax=Bacterioplanes sanyensis TaxID=1249553 RepID=A0A222FMQ7_9GAMM|nr:response regulator [Bacterioplanes sanyensis]ASP40315.1 hypothetical protein CHH28_17245 [Bacterioplanes sanyensis]